MSCNKEHKEFHQVDFTTGWQRPAGYPPGIQLKVLAGAIDLKKKAGGYTRLLRFMPGAFTTEPFVHDHWEEVYVLQGDLIVNSKPDGTGGQTFLQGTYCCRPPGVPHGPFRTETGCLLLETHYYDPM
jgi:ChrR-like protein with cupin domain